RSFQEVDQGTVTWPAGRGLIEPRTEPRTATRARGTWHARAYYVGRVPRATTHDLARGKPSRVGCATPVIRWFLPRRFRGATPAGTVTSLSTVCFQCPNEKERMKTEGLSGRKRKRAKALRKQCRPKDKIVVKGSATLRLSRRAVVVVSAHDRDNVRIERDSR